MKKILTADNTETFLNESVGESYHSYTGAVEEALKKFVEPCRIRELAREKAGGNKPLRLLDFCFGLGYNSAMAVSVALEENPACEIEVVGLENDASIIEKIREVSPPIAFYPAYQKLCRQMGNLQPIQPIQLKEAAPPSQQDRCGNRSPQPIQPKEAVSLFKAADGLKETQQAVNSQGQPANLEFREGKVRIRILLGDARETVKSLPENYFDAVFYDPFSPKTMPEMWSTELLREMWRVMSKSAILATYSCARMVRENLSRAGLIYDEGPIVGRRGPGTIARKWSLW